MVATITAETKRQIIDDLNKDADLPPRSHAIGADSASTKYYIGISSTNTPKINKFHFKESIKNSTFFIPSYYISTVNYLKNSIKKNTIIEELSGPIGMVKMADQLMLDKIKGVFFLFIVNLFNNF